MGGQETARAGNAIGVVGMTVAVVSTYLWFNLDGSDGSTTPDGAAWWIIVAAVLPSLAVGIIMATYVKVCEISIMPA